MLFRTINYERLFRCFEQSSITSEFSVSLLAAIWWCAFSSIVGPWCYTLDPNTRWAYCDIQFCEVFDSNLLIPFPDASPKYFEYNRNTECQYTVYVIDDEMLSRSSAQDYCASNYGGNLPSIHTQLVYDLVLVGLDTVGSDYQYGEYLVGAYTSSPENTRLTSIDYLTTEEHSLCPGTSDWQSSTHFYAAKYCSQARRFLCLAENSECTASNEETSSPVADAETTSPGPEHVLTSLQPAIHMTTEDASTSTVKYETKSSHDQVTTIQPDARTVREAQSGSVSNSSDVWTTTTTGCPCYFEPSNYNCACCSEGACQCPRSAMHQCVQCGYADQCGASNIQGLGNVDGWTSAVSGCPCVFDVAQDCPCCQNYGCQCRNGVKKCVNCGHKEHCLNWCQESKCRYPTKNRRNLEWYNEIS